MNVPSEGPGAFPQAVNVVGIVHFRVSSIIVTHQLRDAFYIANHAVVGTDEGGALSFGLASPEKRDETEFLMLKNGKVAFEGNVDELKSSNDEYLKAFLS